MMTMKTWNNCIYSICINTLSNVYKYFNKCIDDLILKILQRNLISIIFPFKPEFCFHWQNNMWTKNPSNFKCLWKKETNETRSILLRERDTAKNWRKKNTHICFCMCLWNSYFTPQFAPFFTIYQAIRF